MSFSKQAFRQEYITSHQLAFSVKFSSLGKMPCLNFEHFAEFGVNLKIKNKIQAAMNFCEFHCYFNVISLQEIHFL